MVEFLFVNSNDVRPPMLTKRVIFEFQTIEHSPLIINYSVRSSCNDDPKEVYALVVAHDKAHPKQELSGILKRNLVIAAQAKYLELDITISREKIASQMKTQIRKVRGIICPGSTKRGLAKRAIGTSTSHHPFKFILLTGYCCTCNIFSCGDHFNFSNVYSISISSCDRKL